MKRSSVIFVGFFTDHKPWKESTPMGSIHKPPLANEWAEGSRHRVVTFDGGAHRAQSDTVTGLPFYGNLYMGRVNPEDYKPTPHNLQPMKNMGNQKFMPDDDPEIRSHLDRCPYFALCDMVVWHGMHHEFLDPGVLSDEEHHLLLLHSRAYYEKWKEIHAKPREIAPRLRIKRGRFAKCEAILDHLRVDRAQQEKLIERFLDDASLIAMNPNLWLTANLDPTLRLHLTGQIFEGILNEEKQRELFELLDRMRTFVVLRTDKPQLYQPLTGPPEGTYEKIVVNYRDVPTLWNFYKLLGLPSYSGQLKVKKFVGADGVSRTVTINSEDDFFDLTMSNFFNPNLNISGESTSRFVITVDEKTRSQNAVGRWF